MTYRTAATAATTAYDFESQLRQALNRYERMGTEGIDLSTALEKKGPERLVRRNFYMSEDVFELGCRIRARLGDLDPRAWMFWMTNAAVTEREREVVIYHRSRFFCDYADKVVGPALKSYFGKPLRYHVDRGIGDRVMGAE
jgi:hypothetical protein